MGAEHEDLVREALNLPTPARAALAATLIESLDEEIDEGAAAAWDKEVARRDAELRSGKVKPIPWEQARKRIVGE
jgi:putative addiction module component (TIGR02574 family)